MSGEAPGKNVPKEHVHDGIVEYDNDPPLWLADGDVLPDHGVGHRLLADHA